MVNNPYIFIQARMNSERLPGKVLKTIGGKPMIGVLFDRLKDAGVPVLLATSVNTENDLLVEYAKQNNIEVFRGNEDNVLERFYQAAKSLKTDIIIRLTGDNPLIEGDLVKKTLNYYISKKNKRCYLSTGRSKTFPLGISIEIFSFELLDEAYKNALLQHEQEHVTPYIIKNKANDIEIIDFTGEMKKYHYRLTVDTIEDFELMKCLIEDYDCDTKSIEEIVSILDNHTELCKINEGIVQKT